MKLTYAYSYFKRKSKIIFSRYFYFLIHFFESVRIMNTFQKNDQIILVYTIGKVGSTSIYRSISQNKKINIPIFHIHSLNPSRIKEQKNIYLNSKRKSLPFHLIQSNLISKQLEKYNGTLHIITLTREPITREVSSIFQDYFNFFDSPNIKNDMIKSEIKNKIKCLVKTLPESEWFHRELNEVFGLNIFDFDFDSKKGYFVKKNKKLNFCFVRLENLQDSYSKIIKEMFNKTIDTPLVTKNLASEKFYSEKYQILKNNLRICDNDMKIILSNDYIQKFYFDYIDEIRIRWSKQTKITK